MNFLCVVAILCVLIKSIQSKDFTVGTKVDNLLIATKKVEVRQLPLLRRDTDFSYTDPKKRIIKAITARDLDRSSGEVTVTSGGVGDTFVNLHLRSERGERLNYLILIFSDKNL